MLSRALLDDVRELMEPLTDGEAGDYDALLRLLGEARLALLGMPGAEYLGAGGLAFLRLEGRMPVPGWTRHVSADRLGRLVHMMGTRPPAGLAQSDDDAVVSTVEPPESGEPPDNAGEAWYGDRLLKISRPELLLLLAVHPVAGIQSEALADMLWDKTPPDPNAALRKTRHILRGELRRLAPEVT